VTGVALLPMLAFSLYQLADAGTPARGAANSAMSFVNAALQVAAQVVIITIVLADLRGQSTDLATSVRNGLDRYSPALRANVLQGIGTVIGLVLLVVPGLILVAMLSVVTPVVIAEGQKAVASLNRSAALTKGYRWKVFGVMAVLYFSVFTTAAVFITIEATIRKGGIFVAFSEYIAEILTTILLGVIPTVLYYDLRRAKDGLTVNEVATVFD
jgi:uncharacterized membrane protein